MNKNYDYPIIMGILNLTPDSFSDGTPAYRDTDYQVTKAIQMLNNGADIIDIGGESTRPGSEYVSAEEELNRIIPVLKELRSRTNAPISIDTNKAEVAAETIRLGATMINDITGLTGDSEMTRVIANSEAELIIMHMQGTPLSMQDSPNYSDPVSEVINFLQMQITSAVDAGIDKERIIIDPGFGFGKRFNDNCQLMQHITSFVDTGHRVLIGVSRKSMIGDALNLPVEQRMEGSIALAVMSYLQGASIFRVHDVLETRRALDMIYRLHQETPPQKMF